MKSIKRITCLLIILLTFSACTRESYPVDVPTNTLPVPVIEPRNPAIDETASTHSVDEIPQAAVADWDSLYTEDNPVTDPQELIRILQDLKGRFLNQFDKPGWYQLKFGDLETNWIHVSVPGSERFDSVITYNEHEKYPEGFLRPWSFLSLDGHYGRMLSPTLDDFHFVSLATQPPEAIWENLDYYLACDFCVASEHMDFLIQWIRDPDNHISEKSLKETHFSGWVGTYEDQPVFIFKIKVKYLTNMPVTETGEQLQIHDQSYSISLANGGTIVGISDRFYLSGNQDLDDSLPYNAHLITYFETLPERVQTLYDECYRKLIEFEGQN